MGNVSKITDSFIIHIITEDFFEDISNDVEKWFDTSNYDKNNKRPLPIGKNKKVSGLFKDELGGKIITEFVAIRPKTYAYLTDDDDNEHKKAKGTTKCVTKREIIFKNYTDYLYNNKNVYRSRHMFKSYNHDVYTEDVNIALSAMMIKDCKHMIKLQHTHMEQMLLKYVKVKC